MVFNYVMIVTAFPKKNACIQDPNNAGARLAKVPDLETHL
jgi:hypothetical protein